MPSVYDGHKDNDVSVRQLEVTNITPSDWDVLLMRICLKELPPSVLDDDSD